jgi:hypothetical protein
MLGSAIALHWSATVGGVQLASRFAWLWQLPWQFTFELHMAGVTEPSHVGCVTVTLQPPLQVAIAPQLMPPVAVILQLPLHVPLQVPLQCAGVPCVIMQAASHFPLHVPVHIPVLGMPVPPIAVHVPLQLPMHWPVQSMDPPVGGVHVPEQSASQEPVHMAWTVAEPSHVALALHIPLHWPLSEPGSHDAVTLGGVQLAIPLHEASQLASTLALAWHPPPVIESPHCADAPASPERAAEIAIEAWLHASLTSLSSEPPASGPIADHVSVTIRSVSMPTQAVRTLPSSICPWLTTSALAVTNAPASPERLSDEIDPGNWLHPCAAPST